MRSSFILYTSYQHQLELLTMEQRGVLLTAIIAYVAEQEMPEMDSVTQMAFSFIKQDIDANGEKYDRICEARRAAGKKGGRPKENRFNNFPERVYDFAELERRVRG